VLLSSYIERENLTDAGFADLIGVSAAAVNRYAGKASNIPKRDIMVRIYVQTNGDVAPNDFYDLPDLSSVSRSPPASVRVRRRARKGTKRAVAVR
jgi:DNA-binding transcriptional regulator YdaS (Cro superfamily)